MKSTKYKCPFRFRNCSDRCALRVKTRVYDAEKHALIEGYTCAFAANSSTVPNASFTPVFVSEPKVESCERVHEKL